MTGLDAECSLRAGCLGHESEKYPELLVLYMRPVVNLQTLGCLRGWFGAVRVVARRNAKDLTKWNACVQQPAYKPCTI